MRTGARWKLCPFGQRHQTWLACVASSVANSMPVFFSVSHRVAKPGFSFARLARVFAPLLHVGQLASLSICRGERWNE
jgi:hypothetical protein